jgi:hypothetical protein
MRAETDRAKLEALMTALGRAVHGPGRIYLAGGATAVWYGWRETMVDLHLKPDPEPRDCSRPPGRGTVLCARQILADGGDAVPPNPPTGRGTVLRARQILADREDAVPPTPLAEHRTPLCVLCVSVVKPKTCVRPPIGADGEDASLPCRSSNIVPS